MAGNKMLSERPCMEQYFIPCPRPIRKIASRAAGRVEAGTSCDIVLCREIVMARLALRTLITRVRIGNTIFVSV